MWTRQGRRRGKGVRRLQFQAQMMPRHLNQYECRGWCKLPVHGAALRCAPLQRRRPPLLRRPCWQPSPRAPPAAPSAALPPQTGARRQRSPAEPWQRPAPQPDTAENSSAGSEVGLAIVAAKRRHAVWAAIKDAKERVANHRSAVLTVHGAPQATRAHMRAHMRPSQKVRR